MMALRTLGTDPRPLRQAGLSVMALPYGKKFPPADQWDRWCSQPATDDEIRAQFEDKRCNLAVCCGPASGGAAAAGLVVAVFNDRQCAQVFFGRGSDSPLYWTCVAESVRGPHVYIRLDGELPPKTLYYHAGPSRPSVVELRTTGAYVVAPPSRHPSGESYVWITHPDRIGVLPTEQFVDWFTERRRACAEAGWPLKIGASNEGKAPSRGAAHTQTTDEHPPVPRVLPEHLAEGWRNLSLASLGGTLRRRGLDVREINATLQAVNAARGTPPLERAEVARIAASIARYEPNSDFLYDDDQALV